MRVTGEVTWAHLPPMQFDSAEPSGPPSPTAQWLLGFLKPRLVVKAYGEEVLSYAPGGRPEATTWPLLGIVLGLLVALGAFVFIRGILSFRKR